MEKMSREKGFVELALTPRAPVRQRHKQSHSNTHLMLETAKNGSPQELEALLRDGVTANVVDTYEGKSPLHFVLSSGCSCDTCVQDAESCAALLLTSNDVNVNLQDRAGNTALHSAIDSQLTKCAQMLISYGADVNLKNGRGENAVILMARKMPHCLLYLLNESVYLDKYDPHHENCAIKVDLRPIIASSSMNLDTVHPNPSSFKNTTSSDFKIESSNPSINSEGEMKGLMNLLERSGEQILTHPVLQIFLHLKWKKVRPLFWASLVTYVFWVMLYTSYVLQVYVFSCPCELYKRANAKPQELGAENISPKTRCEIETGMSAKVLIIIVSTILLVLIELCRLILTPKIYVRSWLSLGHWVLLACVFATTIPNLQSQTSISALQYQVAAFAVFFAWVLVLPQIGRMPSLAKYVEIFGHVVKCFGSFVLTFVSLYMGFAFSLDNSPFANFFHSSVKVLVMMVGEMDYQDMFYSAEQPVPQSNPVMGHLLFAAFVILVCIVLMNIFVGLTVSDIQALERKAEFSRICRLIVDIFQLEAPLFSKRVPPFFRKLAGRVLSVNRLTFTFYPNDHKDKSIPKSLSQKALQLSESSYKKTRSQRCVRGQIRTEPELVEIPSFFPQNDPNDHDSSTSSSSPSSQSSSPLETNSLDLKQSHILAPFRPWASCTDQTNYH